jgi:hypothetical protein
MVDAEIADDLIPLKLLARELVEGGFTANPPDYGRTYRACLSARFPCEQDDSGRWQIRRQHLPAVATALGLKPPDATAPLQRARRAVIAA